MAALSERKLEIVRTLVEQAPDQVVGSLHAALADTSGDTALASVRRMVESEARDRRLRNIILQPVAPMCVGDGRDPHFMTFPARVLGLLWRGLRATASQQIYDAEVALYDFRPGESPTDPFDRLTRLCAAGVRKGAQAEFRAAAEACDAARPGGAKALADCLDLAPVVRSAAFRLPEWTGQLNEEVTIAARLAYKDAVAVSDDAGPRFFDMLSAQLPHRWMVLRVISAVMDKPTERYLADSELAGFGERLLEDIDAALAAIKKIDLDGGQAAAAAVAREVEMITLQTAELEACVDLTREHGWGARLVKQRKSLATLVESCLRECEKYCSQALPTLPAKLRRIRRQIPRLTLPPDEKAVRRAMTLLAFAHEIRGSANHGGFASARSRMLEDLGEMIDAYVEELIDLIKTGDVESEEVARAFLTVAAELARLIRGEEAGELIRRRGAAASQFAAAATA